MTNKEDIIAAMKTIRAKLDRMAIERADLVHEYRMLNRELGVIEFNEIVAKVTAA